MDNRLNKDCRSKYLNRSNTRWVYYRGQCLCVADWSRKLNKSAQAIYMRLRRGWPPVTAIKKPVRSYSRHAV